MRSLLLPLLALVLLRADADTAARLFASGDYAAAAREYAALLAEKPESAVLRYNLGTSLLLLERWDDARPHLEAATRADDPAVRQAAFYNLGNSELSPAFLAPEPDREALLRAIAAYKQALLLRPGDRDAKWNLELARRLLERREDEQSPQDPSQGGGGGGQGGGGGGNDPQQGEQDPQPQPSGGAGPQPEMTQEAAEQLLSSAERREVGTQRDKLRKPQPPSPSAH